ncbi:MAG: MarR family transcriptional regulator [Solobacterium sp.]|nr:MarR family transcriptional regulator [Solobacterium sp.]HAE16110.1 MarR family transcriptional regulator [Erysipelotrichaceae bacterium]
MDLGFKIKKINDMIEKGINHRLQELDLTFSQHHVLVYLERQENKTARLKELEKHFNVAQPTMAGIVVRLESKGLVRSSLLPEDRRVKVVTLTDSGSQLLHESFLSMRNGEKLLVSKLNDNEKEELGRLLDILYSTIQEQIKIQEEDSGKENIC